MKKLMLGALAALCAMLALPAIAAATPAHIDQVPEGGFEVHGGHSELTRVGGGGTTGTTVTGSGSFENTTTGTVTLTFTGVKSSIGTNCTNTGVAGEVKTTPLTFHLVQLPGTTVPGMLFTGGGTTTAETPNEGLWGHHFATFGCGIFIPKVVVRGNGVLGTITAPECGGKSPTATVSFKAKEAGVQEHTEYTGTKYNLESDLGGGYAASAMEAHATVTFKGGERTLVCTH